MNKADQRFENDTEEFSFGDSSVAHGYDSRLVPILFVPWADRLIKENRPWTDRRVLDLATGTGVVAQRLSEQVGPGGKVLAADISAEMLELAKKRCVGSIPAVEFIECSADQLDIADGSIDFVTCQQGFQFFPDKAAAAQEMHRVLCDGGRTVISIWRPLAECLFFAAVCEALVAIGEPKIADMMNVPFSDIPASELVTSFQAAGFTNVRLERQELDLVLDGGIAQGIKVAYSTPIGPKLKKLSDQQQDEFRKRFTEILTELSPDGANMGCMVSNVLSAEKLSRRS